MAKIDRLRWEAGIAIEAFGVKLGVRVNTPEALDVITPHLPFGWQVAATPVVDHLHSVIMAGASTRRGVRRYNLLYSGSWRAVRTLEPDELLHRLARLLDFHVAVQTPERLFVHAGVVGWQGRAIVIPGRSLSGKTTLVKALVETGATYYSDEFAVLDGDGVVHPHPRPLNIREGAVGPGTPTPVEEIGGQVGTEPLRVGWIVDTVYEPDSTWRPNVLPPEQGLLRLMDNTVVARLAPERALPILRRVVLQASTLHGPRGDVADIVPHLSHLALQPV